MIRNMSRCILAMTVLAVISSGCGPISSLLGGGLPLQDDFSSDGSGWGTGTDSENSVEYSNGGLRMQVFIPNYIVSSRPNATDYENIHTEVTVTHNDTNPTTAFGVLCNQQGFTASYYYFVITPAGEYAIIKAAEGQTDIFLTNNGWASSDLITQNADSYRVGADCGDGTLTLYVDENEIASVSESTYTSGRVGLIAWSDVDASSTDVTFDDFLMTELP